MKIVNFKKVKLENFCCYKSPIEYEFKNDSIILITGPNGVGKSSIFASLPYTLYGITPTGMRGDDVVNNEVGKNCYTALEFDIDDAKYICERYTKNSKLGNTVTLKKDGELIKKGHTEVITEIERILIPQKLFLNTLLFGQKVKTFFTDLTDTEQKDIFRKVLQLDNYALYYDEVSIKLKDGRKDLDKILENINLIDGLIKECYRQISLSEESKVKFEEAKKNDLKRLTNEKEKVYKEITRQKNILSEYGDDDLNLLYKNLENRYTEVAHSIEIIENNKSNELSKLLSEKREKENSITNEKSSRISETEALKNSEISNKRLFYQQESKDLEIELANLKKNIEIARKDYSEKNTEYFTLKNEVEELNNNLSASSVICPLCKQVIGKDNIHHLKNELTQKINKINELENYLHSMVENAAKTKDHISSLEAKIKNNSNNCELQIENIVKDFNEKSKDINDRYRIAINKINDLFEKMTSSIEEKAKTEEISLRETLLRLGNEKASMSDKIKEKQKIVDTITSLEYNFENWCNIIENKLSDYFDETILLASRKRLEDLKEDEGKNKVLKDNQESLLEKYDFWKTGFSMSGIPSMLIDEAIPFMNKRIEYYLDQIGGRYIVSFDTLNKNKGGEFKDKIAVNVYDNLTKANMRKQLSGGQTRVVDIATILTLRDLQNNIQDMKTNIIILDEIFDSLDSKNIEYVSTVLRKMTKGNSINIISHTQIDQLDVDETLRFL